MTCHCLLRRGRHCGAWSIVLLLGLLSPLVFAGASPLLWKVSATDDESEASVYLLGAIHFGRPSMYPLSASVMQAYERAEALVVELDIAALDQQQVSGLITAHGIYGEGDSLVANLGTDTWRRLQQVCDELEVEADSFRSLKPWLVAVQLVSLQMHKSGYREEWGVDRFFLNRARGSKPIRELESIEEQLSIFSRLSNREQALLLEQALDTTGEGRGYLQSLARAWSEAEKQELERLVLEPFELSGEQDPVGEKIFRLVFGDRNLRMADAVEQFLRDRQQVFVVVGVGHLLGDKGVAEELRRRGYRVDVSAP